MPKEWNQLIKKTGEGSPYVGHVIDRGMDVAQAIVVLLTGDDIAALKEEYHDGTESPESPEPQPRPNVLFEAGMAFGKAPERTILVQFGKVKKFSDVVGRHILIMNDSVEKRKELLDRLETAGCDVDMSGNDWMSDGDFSFLKLAK